MLRVSRLEGTLTYLDVRSRLAHYSFAGRFHRYTFCDKPVHIDERGEWRDLGGAAATCMRCVVV